MTAYRNYNTASRDQILISWQLFMINLQDKNDLDGGIVLFQMVLPHLTWLGQGFRKVYASLKMRIPYAECFQTSLSGPESRGIMTLWIWVARLGKDYNTKRGICQDLFRIKSLTVAVKWGSIVSGRCNITDIGLSNQQSLQKLMIFPFPRCQQQPSIAVLMNCLTPGQIEDFA